MAKSKNPSKKSSSRPRIKPVMIKSGTYYGNLNARDARRYRVQHLSKADDHSID